MAEALRVDPDQLCAAARAQTDVSTFVSEMGTGQLMTDAGTGMPGLLSEAACRVAASIFDVAENTVRDELTTHSAKLVSAAGLYDNVDAELGRRLDERMT